MKNYLPYLFSMFILASGYNCSKKNVYDLKSDQTIMVMKEAITSANSICGSANPEQSLKWLKDIIGKGEEDKLTKKYNGNYMGKILSTSYHNQPVFYITMPLGSGGIYAYIYDCNGNTVNISQDDIIEFEENARQGKSIYSNGL